MKWGLFIVIINLFAHCFAEDIYTLEFRIEHDRSNGGDLRCYGGTLDIEQNKQYQIRVYNPPGRTVYREAKWGRAHDMNEIKMLAGHGTYSQSHKFTASARGNFEYTGVFFTHNCSNKITVHDVCYYKYHTSTYTDLGVTCQATINVYLPGDRIIKPEAKLTVNTQTFSTSGSEQNYYYYDGEGTIFNCTKIVGSYIQLQFTTTAGRFVSTNIQAAPSVSMYVKLTSKLNGIKLQCIVSEKHQQQDITLHLTLIQQEFTGFRVNGLIPPLKSQPDSDVYKYYEYIFHDDENLTVEFIKNTKFGPSSCSVEGSNVPFKLKEFFKSDTRGLVAKSLDKDAVSFPLSEGGGGTFLTCIVTNYYLTESHFNYTVKFVFHNPAKEPYFFDLSMSNILLSFWNNSGHQLEYEMDSTAANPLFCVCCDNKDNPLKLSDHNRPVEKLELRPDQTEDNLKCGSRTVRVVRKKTVSHSIPQGYTTRSPLPTRRDYAQNPTKTALARDQDIGVTDQNHSYQAPNPLTTEKPTEEGKQQALTPRNEIEPKPQKNHDNRETPTFQSSSETNYLQKSSTDLMDKEKIHNSDRNIKPQRDELVGRSHDMPANTGRSGSRGPGLKKNHQQLPQTKTNTELSYTSFNETKSNTRSSTKRTTTSSEVEDTSTTPPNEVIELHRTVEGNQNSSGTEWKLALSVVVVILLFAAVLWLGHSYIRKRRMKHNPHMDYQNLPEHLEGPMATPSQWDNRPDDVTYSHPVIENFYTVPVINANRQYRPNIEPVYSQPRDSNNTYENTGVSAMEINQEAGYAEVGQTGPTYAEPGLAGPTYAEAGLTGPTYAEAGLTGPTGPTYAEARLARPTGPTYASVQKSSTLKRPQDTYAQVQKKHERNSTRQMKASHYQNVDANKPDKLKKVLPQVNYANVQDVIPEFCGYVNSDVREDLEPAYSELSKKM